MTNLTRIALSLLAVVMLAAPALAQPEDARQEREYDRIKERLRTQRISVDFDETPFEEAIEYIQRTAQVNMIISREVRHDIGDEPITLRMSNTAAGNVLNVMLDFVGLAYTFRHGVMMVTTPDDAVQGRTVLRIYDVRDLTFPIRDFPGVRIRLRGDEGDGGAAPVWEEDFDEPEPITTDELEDIIPQFTGGDSWDDNPEATILQVGGLLVVRQQPEVHLEIARLLGQLRANR